ncbi:hypothetical protein [Candidatus Poriferisodalis sp.]|uniref:hypothetical protein n=1 Tax=Candidatus Poriferisodalis sp. TaxID=3101277 RepID=UPI003B012665
MSEYKRGTRVIVNEDLPGVPEGTPGKCGRGLGFAIKRYRVRFDNDVEVISVAHSKLVPEDEWPQFLAKRARAEIEAAQERARLAEARAAAAESRGLPAGSTDKPPAQDTAAAAPAPAEPAGDDGAADPRLAAILARSKSAREATGVPAPESTAAPAAEKSAAEPSSAAAAEPAAAAPATAASPKRSAPPSGPERVEVPEFVPGPEVDPDYAPAANRVSELISETRKDA